MRASASMRRSALRLHSGVWPSNRSGLTPPDYFVRYADHSSRKQKRRQLALPAFVFGCWSYLGADLLAARESAFWMVKAAGADDVIDMVVPRNRIPDYLRRVQALTSDHGSKVFGCGHAGDGNIHFSVYEPDAARRSKLLTAIFEMGMAMGGAISGEHGIGRTKKHYYQALEDPGKLALQRRIKAAFDPHGILNPGCIFD